METIAIWISFFTDVNSRYQTQSSASFTKEPMIHSVYVEKLGEAARTPLRCIMDIIGSFSYFPMHAIEKGQKMLLSQDGFVFRLQCFPYCISVSKR